MVTCHEIVETLFSYTTPKIVQIKSILIGVISRIIQLSIIAYIIGFAIIYKRGYQEFCDVESSVTTKVKGVVFTNFSDDQFKERVTDPDRYRRIWDVADYVVPPSENGATFIATNVIITANQTQETCPEDATLPDALCDPENNTCIAGESLPVGNGVMTGNCISVKNGSGVYSCEVQAWCPVEDDTFPLKNKTALLEGSQDFTILVKNFVDFPKFSNSHRRNIREKCNGAYLKSCRYDPDDNPDCPVFRLGDIVKWSDQKDYDSIAFRGGVIGLTIKWDCNLDYDKKYCYPTYAFNRLDDPDAKIAQGWNFRYADFYADGRRTLYKMYGIRISIRVVGQAGQFRIVPLLTNVGAGLGLLALEVVICDIVVLYLTKRRKYFKSKKYEEVVDPDVETPETAPTVPEISIPKYDTVLSRNVGDGYQRLED